MIPAQLRVLSEIPLTGNGKIDRDALQALTSSAPQQPPVNAQAPSSVEQAVIQVWQSVLQTPVDRDANFFAQGGDSLTGIRVVTRLREQHGYSASLRLVLSHPVLQDFAAQLNPAPAPLPPAQSPAQPSARPRPMSPSFRCPTRSGPFHNCSAAPATGLRSARYRT